MTDYTDTSVKELIINKLTKAQYDAAVQAGTINENELYMVTDTTYPTTEELVAGYQPLINATNKLDGANVANLANVAYSGEYSDLLNIPEIAQSDWTETNTASPAFILNKPSLANIATTGEWNDLVNTPDFKNIATTAEWTDLVNVPDFKNIATTAEYSDLLNTPTVDQVYNASSTNAQSGTAVANAISSAISAVYKPAGSSTFANLPTPGASNLGNVYNMSEEFTIDDRFVDYDSSTTKTYPAGTNVVVVNTGTDADPVYKFDVLTGFIDLSPYALTNSLANVALSGEYEDLLNKPTVDQVYNAQSANAQSGVAVASAISDMQVVSNMVDVVSNTSTNTTYPTASAVYNIVDTKSTVTFRNWSAS